VIRAQMAPAQGQAPADERVDQLLSSVVNLRGAPEGGPAMAGHEIAAGLGTVLSPDQLQGLRNAGVTGWQIGQLDERIGREIANVLPIWGPAGVKLVLDAAIGAVDPVSLARVIRMGKDFVGAYFDPGRTAAFITAVLPSKPSPGEWLAATVLLRQFGKAKHQQGPLVNGRHGALAAICETHPGRRAGIPAYSIKVLIGKDGVEHIKSGHTFESFHFSLANVHRAQGANVSMFAPGTDIAAEAQKASAAYSVFMDNASFKEEPSRDDTQAGYVIAYGEGYSDQARHGVRPVNVVQLYPKGANAFAEVPGPVLEGIGRILGYIT
jgi:hypothetical protein